MHPTVRREALPSVSSRSAGALQGRPAVGGALHGGAVGAVVAGIGLPRSAEADGYLAASETDVITGGGAWLVGVDAAISSSRDLEFEMHADVWVTA